MTLSRGSRSTTTNKHFFLKALEDLSIEKQTMKERYERELEGLKSKFSKSESAVQQQHDDDLNKLRQQSQDDLATLKRQSEEALEQMKQVHTIFLWLIVRAVSLSKSIPFVLCK